MTNGVGRVLKKSDLCSSLWKSCDELRGGMDALQYNGYIPHLAVRECDGQGHGGCTLVAGRARKQLAAKPATSLEQRLWDVTDALRGVQEPSESKHVILGLVFLKCISDLFDERRRALEASLKNPDSRSLLTKVEHVHVLPDHIVRFTTEAVA